MARAVSIEKAFTGLGGRLEAFDFAFGDVDAYVIVDLRDNVTAAAMGSTKTVVLLTMEEPTRPRRNPSRIAGRGNSAD